MIIMLSRKSTYNYEKDLSEKIKTNPKLFWKHVGNETKTKTTVQRVVKNNGELTEKSRDTANVLNEFFSSVFVHDDNREPPELRERTHENLPEFKELTHEKVITDIRSTNPNKAPGPDNLHPKFIVETCDTIAKPLQIILKKVNR